MTAYSYILFYFYIDKSLERYIQRLTSSNSKTVRKAFVPKHILTYINISINIHKEETKELAKENIKNVRCKVSK